MLFSNSAIFISGIWLLSACCFSKFKADELKTTIINWLLAFNNPQGYKMIESLTCSQKSCCDCGSAVVFQKNDADDIFKMPAKNYADRMPVSKVC